MGDGRRCITTELRNLADTVISFMTSAMPGSLHGARLSLVSARTFHSAVAKRRAVVPVERTIGPLSRCDRVQWQGSWLRRPVVPREPGSRDWRCNEWQRFRWYCRRCIRSGGPAPERDQCGQEHPGANREARNALAASVWRPHPRQLPETPGLQSGVPSFDQRAADVGTPTRVSL